METEQLLPGGQLMSPEQAFILEQQLAFAMFEQEKIARQNNGGQLPPGFNSQAAAMQALAN